MAMVSPTALKPNTGDYVSPTDTGTNPNNADTDGDGVNDGDEVSNGTDPNEAPGPQLPVIESDGNTYLLEDYSLVTLRAQFTPAVRIRL
jgi:hypothetical protein